MVSDIQIKANIKNSQKSTGPKDTTNTRFNAIKHGICSKKFVNESDLGDFNKIFNELIEDLNPQSIIELRITEKMAFSLWEYQKIIDHEQKSNYSMAFGDSYLLDNLLQRYKFEADNKFYRAIKVFQAVKNNYCLGNGFVSEIKQKEVKNGNDN